MGAEKKKFNISRQSLSALCLFAAALAFMLWKCRYGLGGSDEAFYLTVPHRLCLGDELFRDEWHLSQLSSFLTLPFVWLYRLINGSNDGIMLAARLNYVALHSLAAIVVYLRLKKFGWAALPAALVFMLFTPFDMMCLSYNTIALDALTLSGVISGTAGESSRAAYAASGALFACAVVCCPYLAAAYLIYFRAAAAYALVCRRTGKRVQGLHVLTWRVLGLFTGGIAAVCVLFAVFFFRHAEIGGLISALPGLFSDPEHPGYSVIFMIKHYVYCLVTAHRLMPVPLALYALSLVLLALDKKRGAHAPLHLALAAAAALICWALFLDDLPQEYFNGIMLPFAFVGFTAYLLLADKPRALFCMLFLPGVIYSACVSATSNMGFTVMSMAFAAVDVASVIFTALLIRQMQALPGKRPRFGTVAGCVPLVWLISLIIIVKAAHCFWDGMPAALHSRVEAGPARGIITSARLHDDYMRIYDDMRYYSEKERGNILVYAQETWCYLILDDYPYASFSAWLSGTDESTQQRLALYYRLNPEKYPEYIYILKNTAFSQPNIDASEVYAAAEKHGFSVTENELSFKLEKIS